MKKALESIGNRADHMEERINELKHGNLEDTSRRKSRPTIKGMWNNIL